MHKTYRGMERFASSTSTNIVFSEKSHRDVGEFTKNHISWIGSPAFPGAKKMARKVTEREVLDALVGFLKDWETIDWASIPMRQQVITHTVEVPYRKFEDAVRASGILTSSYTISEKWKNLIADGTIVEVCGVSKSKSKGVFSLHDVKMAIPRLRELGYAPAKVKPLAVYGGA